MHNAPALGFLMFFGMIGISATWLLLFAAFSAIGHACQRMIGEKTLDAETILSSFWFGWSFVLLALQLWHLRAPIDARIFLFTLGFGAAGTYWCRNDIADFFRQKKFEISWILLILLLILWLANQAMGPLKSYDAGLYHLSAIRWISFYPIVPGLANLHDRLGFNSSYFLFQSMLDVGLWTHRSHHLASGLLLLTVLLEIVLSIYKTFAKQPVYLHDLMRLLLLAPVIDQCFTQASSTSPDLPIFVIGVLISIRLCRLLFSEQTPGTLVADISLVVILSAIGTTIKLSFVAFGFFASLVAIMAWAYRRVKQTDRSDFLKLIPASAVAFLILSLWISRNIILTGYPVYPVAYSPIDVEWKVTPENLSNLNGWLRTWARNPNAAPRQLQENAAWVQRWISEVLSRYKFYVSFPLLLFAVGTLMLIGRTSPKTLPLSACILFFLPPLGMLAFWFLSAPDPRYAGATFWYLGAGAISLGYGGFCHDYRSEESNGYLGAVSYPHAPHISAELEDHKART